MEQHQSVTHGTYNTLPDFNLYDQIVRVKHADTITHRHRHIILAASFPGKPRVTQLTP